ncbi:MAG TPA: ABC transporter ATP-binding protein [Spirochaetia bacterium]|nr:ABC transporter ATP-binding protein [Spirochaetia bacterium]
MLSTFFSLLVVVVALVPPAIAQRIVDYVFVPSVKEGNFSSRTTLLVSLIAVLVVAAILRAGLIFLRNNLVEVYSQRAQSDLKQRLYDQIQAQSFGFFHNTRTGELMARMTNDVEMVRGLLSNGLLQGASGILFFIGAAILLALLNWQLALISALASPWLFITALKLRTAMRPTTTAVRAQFSRLNTRVQENISGIRVVKAFMRHAFELQRFQEENSGLTAARNRNLAVWARYLPSLEFLSGISSAIVMLAGGWMVIRGRITLGTWVQFNGYLWMIVQPMRTLGDVANQVAMAESSAERLCEILDTRPAVVSPAVPRRLERIRGDVELRNVSWAVDGHEILEGINLHAPAGSTIAIMGPTGCGKTSLVNLIPRFFDPDQGQVLVDGIDVRELDLKQLRASVGLVAQETFLFSDTLYGNLTYGQEDAPIERVREAAVTAQAEEFISPLEEGYETVVGERGVGLSGGQKQRASLARALMKQAPILILDDATSSVDMETETRIQAALRELEARATTFIIAHRISSVLHADQILVMDHGRIVERGRHAELVRLGGLYAEYFRVQYGAHGGNGHDDGDGREGSTPRSAAEAS